MQTFVHTNMSQVIYSPTHSQSLGKNFSMSISNLHLEDWSLWKETAPEEKNNISSYTPAHQTKEDIFTHNVRFIFIEVNGRRFHLVDTVMLLTLGNTFSYMYTQINPVQHLTQQEENIYWSAIKYLTSWWERFWQCAHQYWSCCKEGSTGQAWHSNTRQQLEDQLMWARCLDPITMLGTHRCT